MLDYGYSLHKQIFRFVNSLDKLDDAIAAKYNLVELEVMMRQLSVYIEIRYSSIQHDPDQFR